MSQLIDTFDEEVTTALDNFVDNTKGEAARETLAMGLPIYYSEKDTPKGLLIKEYPNGAKELVKFNKGNDKVIRVL